MEYEKRSKLDCEREYYYFYCWMIQISLWVFDALIILNFIMYGHLSMFEYSTILNIFIFLYAIFNYICYLCINVVVSFCYLGINNQKTDSEIIDKIKNQINDNSYTDSIIEYECYHFLKKGEERKENYIYKEYKDSPTKVITKSGSMNYSFKSMRDISGNIYLKTLGYANMKVVININVEMDEETKKDFEEVKEGFFVDCKNSDEFFKTNIKHNFNNNRYSKNYLVKVNGGKASFIYNKYLFVIISFLGFTEVIKAIIKCVFNRRIQTINIKKIISSKYDLNDPYVIQMFGYDRLSTNFYLNDNLCSNNNYYKSIKDKDEGLTINETLLPK